MQTISYLLSIGLIFVLLGCGTTIATRETPKSTLSMKATAHYSSMNLPKMSMDEFEQIKNGMTYKQVTEIVGSTGEIVAETGNPGDKFYTVTYQYKGEGRMWSNANAQLMFQGGRLTTKTQSGIYKFPK